MIQKKIFLFSYMLLFMIPISFFGQASDSQKFSINFYFERNILVDSLDVSYFKKSNNSFDTINVKVNRESNSITIFGINNFVVLYSFPTIIFSYTINKKSVKTHQLFSFISVGCESYGNRYCVLSDADMKTIPFSFTKKNLTYNASANCVESDVLNITDDIIFNKLVKIKKIK